jgi:hypothetical protein
MPYALLRHLSSSSIAVVAARAHPTERAAVRFACPPYATREQNRTAGISSSSSTGRALRRTGAVRFAHAADSQDPSEHDIPAFIGGPRFRCWIDPFPPPL